MVRKTGDTSRLTILVVDDIDVNRLILRLYLEPLGHTVLEAASGEAAIEIVREGGVDFVFMDISMPGIDGFEAAKRIRAISELGEMLPIVAASADASLSARAQAVDAGIDDYLCKPITVETVEAMVARYRPDRRRYRPEAYNAAAAAPVRSEALEAGVGHQT